MINVQQMSDWMAPSLQGGKEALICKLPMHPVYTLMRGVVFVRVGAQTVMMPTPGGLSLSPA